VSLRATRIGIPYWSVHAKSALFCPAFAISLDCTQASVDLSCDEPRVLELAIRTDSRRPTVSLDRSASRAHCQHSQSNLPPTQARTCEILTMVTRGRKNARQVLIPPRPGRRPNNRSTLSFNFKCHPQAPAFRLHQRVCPLTFSRSRCELRAPEASWPAPSRSKRRCGRYPPLQPRLLTVLTYRPNLASTF
jgi:hypothetical protein